MGFYRELQARDTRVPSTCTGEQLDTWLKAVASSPLTDLKSFVGSVYEDKEAILAGLTKAESNGPTGLSVYF